MADVGEQARASQTSRSAAASPTRAAAIAIAPGCAEQTRLEVVVRGSKRGRDEDGAVAWRCARRAEPVVRIRPMSASDALFVSLRRPRSARPEAISASAVGDVVAKHAAGAGVREDRRTAHALRHTFCTMLAERDVALEVIRELAGHVDVRTTQIYVDVTDQRKTDGIARLEQRPHPLAK